jgi:hypothetical protein
MKPPFSLPWRDEDRVVCVVVVKWFGHVILWNIGSINQAIITDS